MLASRFTVYINNSLKSVLSCNKISYSLTWNFFPLKIAVTIPLEYELSVLIRFVGREKPSSVRVLQKGTYVSHCIKFHLLLLRKRKPQCASVFYILCGLIHLKVV